MSTDVVESSLRYIAAAVHCVELCACAGNKQTDQTSEKRVVVRKATSYERLQCMVNSRHEHDHRSNGYLNFQMIHLANELHEVVPNVVRASSD